MSPKRKINEIQSQAEQLRNTLQQNQNALRDAQQQAKHNTDEYESNPKLIQIRFCEGGWRFKDLGNGKIKVIHNLIVDPAGSAPAWIVNSKTVDDPIKTYKSLREMIKNEKYQGQSFSLLQN